MEGILHDSNEDVVYRNSEAEINIRAFCREIMRYNEAFKKILKGAAPRQNAFHRISTSKFHDPRSRLL